MVHIVLLGALFCTIPELNRKYTLASGGKVCDYWFVGDKMKNPK